MANKTPDCYLWVWPTSCMWNLSQRINPQISTGLLPSYTLFPAKSSTLLDGFFWLTVRQEQLDKMLKEVSSLDRVTAHWQVFVCFSFWQNFLTSSKSWNLHYLSTLPALHIFPSGICLKIYWTFSVLQQISGREQSKAVQFVQVVRWLLPDDSWSRLQDGGLIQSARLLLWSGRIQL